MYADSLKRILKRTDERRGCIVGWLTFWNPKNLQKKVDMYGYHFSWKTHAVMIFLALAGVIGIGAVFRLKAGGVVIALTAVIMMLPVLVLDMYHKMYEQKRFADAAEYMEQMLYAFQKTGKILSALKETREIFEEGKMRSCIERVILKLEFGDFSAGENVFESALEPIESQYQCPKIKMLHELLINAEEHGGEMSESALLLLEDIELWKRRGYQLQAEKKKSHTDNIISVIVSVILCATALYVLDSMKDLFVVKTDFNIFGVGIIQVSSLVFLLFLLWVFVKSSRNLTNDWLATEKVEKEQEISSSCEMVYHYNEKKEKRKSMLWALPAAGMMLAAVLAGKLILAGILFPVTLFLAMQHKVGYQIAKRDVKEAVYLALPGWFMELALLLQNNNVQVSIEKSKNSAPPVLRYEIECLEERLKKTPEKLSAYTEFCKEFDVPEAQNCMKMLHAVAEMGTGDAVTQMNHLIMHVNEMQNRAEEIRNGKIAFRQKMIFCYSGNRKTSDRSDSWNDNDVSYAWKYGRCSAMRQIIGAFGILFIMMANIFICTGLIGASGQVAAAKEYKSQVVAELENSNFNPGVIDACKKKAAEDGYELEISDCVYDAWQNMRAAQVALKYHYRIPVLGIYEENITYAIAR